MGTLYVNYLLHVLFFRPISGAHFHRWLQRQSLHCATFCVKKAKAISETGREGL
jgi:hypothetical protein